MICNLLSASRRLVVPFAAAAVVLANAPAAANDEPVVGNSWGSARLGQMAKPAAQRTAVAVHEFSSGVPEITAKAGAEMLITALVRSKAFVVLERLQLERGVATERAILANARGAGSDTPASPVGTLAGAKYLLYVTVSEGVAEKATSETKIGLGGFAIESGSRKDSIAIDIRVVDPTNGAVITSFDVRKTIPSQSSGMSGVGALAQSIAALRGRSLPIVPDFSTRSTRREGVDEALRVVIEAAVIQLGKELAEA